MGEKPAPNGAKRGKFLVGELVIVLDADGKFLERTSGVKARVRVKNGEARIHSRDPFAIKLTHVKDAASVRRRTSMSVRNFTEYFKDEREIFVQNLSNAQVSVEFPVAPNRVEGYLFPYSRDPINLTQYFPFDVIKRSTDLRKMINRRPPVLQVLSDEEYQAYFAQKAKQRGLVDSNGKPDVEAAIDQAEDARRRTTDKSTREMVASSAPDPIHEVVESGTGPGGMPHFGERSRVRPSETFNEDEVINPRILHLCNQVKSELKDEERMSAQDLLEALQQIPELRLDDYEHIRAHGYYKTVKKWAKVEAAKLSAQGEEDDEEQPETEAPANKLANKKTPGTQVQA